MCLRHSLIGGDRHEYHFLFDLFQYQNYGLIEVSQWFTNKFIGATRYFIVLFLEGT